MSFWNVKYYISYLKRQNHWRCSYMQIAWHHGPLKAQHTFLNCLRKHMQINACATNSSWQHICCKFTQRMCFQGDSKKWWTRLGLVVFCLGFDFKFKDSAGSTQAIDDTAQKVTGWTQTQAAGVRINPSGCPLHPPDACVQWKNFHCIIQSDFLLHMLSYFEISGPP